MEEEKASSLPVAEFLKLHPSVTPDVIDDAAKAGITGVKMYPQGKPASRRYPLRKILTMSRRHHQFREWRGRYRSVLSHVCRHGKERHG